MEKTIRQIEQDIKAGRDREENTKLLFSELAASYYELAGIELNMNFYSFSERFNGFEKRGIIRDLYNVQEMLDKTVELIKAAYSGGSVEAAYELRNKIIADTKLILSYADSFQLYEYCLDRVSPSFEEKLNPIDNENIGREILKEMFKSGDNMVINENIKLMVQSMPVRMAKGRFFDICRESLAEYIGAPADAFEKMMYFIRSSAGVDCFEEPDERFGDLYRIYKELEDTDFGKLTKEDYDDISGRLKDIVRKSMDAVEAMRSLEEVLNELLVVSMTRPYVGDDRKDGFNRLHPVFEEAVSFFEAEEEPVSSDEVTELFASLEGKLESSIELMERLEGSFDSAAAAVSGADFLKEISDISDRCRILMSSSLFVELDEETDDAPLTEERFEKEFGVLEQDIADSLSRGCRLLKRARMAAVLYQIPVFFKNRTEVMNYLLGSLESCSDVAEKMAAIRHLLDALQESEYDFT